MTPEELDGCLRMLEAYYPGDWPLERIAVWADAFTAFSVHEAQAALKQMAQTEKFPTVAAFMAATKNPPGVICDGNRRFLPGTGWLGDTPPELEAVGDGDPVVVSMARAREALRRKEDA